MVVKKKSRNSTTTEPTKKEKVKSFSVELPTEKTEPVNDISQLVFLVYGEKKIGKTSFAAQFPNALFFAFEKGFKGLSVYVVEPKSWTEFKAYILALTKQDHDFETIIIDTVDKLYEMCFAHVCKIEGFEHPSEEAYGKGWEAVKKELNETLDNLIKTGMGIVFLSHATEKTFMERTGGTYDKIIPTMANAAKAYASGVSDAIIFYGYHGEERLLTIRGSDAVESGTRMKHNFWIEGGYEPAQELMKEKLKMRKAGTLSIKQEQEINKTLGKYRVHSIPAGESEEETFFNFNLAFHNHQRTTGRPKIDAANIEKVEPMKSKGK